jgi:hypothetical protein
MANLSTYGLARNFVKQNVEQSIQDTRKLLTNMKFKRHMKGRHKKSEGHFLFFSFPFM